MITHQKYWIIVLAFLTIHTGVAQIDRNITVERDFEPVIQDAGKITGIPEVFQIDTKKGRVDYSEIYQPLSLDRQIVTLSAEQVKHEPMKSPREAFLRLGAGNYWNTLGELALPMINKEKDRLDLRLNHLGTFGKKQHAFSRANLAYNHYFTSYDLYAEAGVSHRFFNYYGDNFHGIMGDTIDLNNHISTISEPFPDYTEQNLTEITRTPQTINLGDLANNPLNKMMWRYHAQIGFRSLPAAVGTKHMGELNYEFMDVNGGLKETIVKANYGFDMALGAHRLGVDVDFKNLFYGAKELTQINFWNYYAVLSLNPYYLMEGDNWYLRAGLKTIFSIVHGRVFNPMPDVSGEWCVFPKWLSLYGGVVGDFKLSNLNTIYAENPYVYHDLRVKDVYTPVNPYFGFKLKPLHPVLIDAFVDYRYIVDQYFYVNKAYASGTDLGDFTNLFINRFDVLYSNASLFKTGMRINYNHKDIVNLQLKGVYNAWNVKTEAYAWMKPALEVDFSTDVRINKNLKVMATAFYVGERYAKLGDNPFKMNPKIDINLGSTYTFNKTFSAFAQLNNLLNSKYQEFYGYEMQGINFMLGGAVSF
jgi:hypothetical protein